MAKKKTSEEYGIDWQCHLKVFRAKNDLTQEDIAKALGITRQTISGIEKKKYNPSLLLAYKISKYFSVTIEEMFSFSELEK